MESTLLNIHFKKENPAGDIMIQGSTALPACPGQIQHEVGQLKSDFYLPDRHVKFSTKSMKYSLIEEPHDVICRAGKTDVGQVNLENHLPQGR